MDATHIEIVNAIDNLFKLTFVVDVGEFRSSCTFLDNVPLFLDSLLYSRSQDLNQTTLLTIKLIFAISFSVAVL